MALSDLDPTEPVAIPEVVELLRGIFRELQDVNARLAMLDDVAENYAKTPLLAKLLGPPNKAR